MNDISVTALDGSPHLLSAAAVEELKQNLRGQLLMPGEAGYEDACRIWNGIHNKRPGLMIRCTGTADVMDAVNFAREHGILVSIRGGGHNVAGTATNDGGIMIDLSLLRGVHVDPWNRTADVEPGVTLGDLDRETQAFGLVAPAGIVSTTGVAGLTLAGGMGWVRRKYGLTIDNLLSADIVTADGRFLRASETENADLFWAIRGGGGNFGVVTSFRFRLQPLGPMVYLAAPLYPVEQAARILPLWRDYCETSPDEVSSFFVFQTIPAAPVFPEALWNRQVIVVPALYAGPVEEGEKVLKPIREFGDPLLDLTSPIPFRQVQQMFDGFFPSGARYYWKTTTLPALNAEAISTLLDIGTSRSSPRSVVGIWQMGGAISRVPADATGYGPRSDPWTVALDSGWIDPAEDEQHITATREAWERLQPVSSGGMYVQYGMLEKQEQITTAYGPCYNRLVEVKNKYDPMNLFRVNQNIKPSVEVHA